MTVTADEDDGFTSAQIAFVLEGMDGMAVAGMWSELSERFTHLKPEGMTPTEMVSYLRGSFRYRQNISAWNDLRDRCHKILLNRGYDSDDMFRGLF